MEKFKKYEERKAYHWTWFQKNTFNYRDRVDLILKYFPSEISSFEIPFLLDIGCGDGCISWNCFTHGFNVVGIDTNNFALDLAKKEICNFLIETYGNFITFSNDSVYSIKPNTYDYILCNEVIEHLEHPSDAIKIMHSAVKEFCLITTPDANKHKVSKYDYQLFNKKGIEKLFSKYHTECESHYNSFWIKLYKE